MFNNGNYSNAIRTIEEYQCNHPIVAGCCCGGGNGMVGPTGPTHRYT